MPRPPILTEPTPDHLRAFLAGWPPGIGRLETTDGDVFGLLMRRGVDVVWCRSAVFDAVDNAFALADEVARAVLRQLALPRLHAIAATATVVGDETSQRVGLAVFCFDETSELQPGAGGEHAAATLAQAVSNEVGVGLSSLTPTTYDAIGTYRLEGMATPAGLLFIGRTVPEEDDPVWHEWPGSDPIVHLPSVAFAEEASEDDA